MNPESEFSVHNRNQYINQLKNNQFDLLVIGGGITGAGIALDAVLRGLKVALIEKQDFAAGTSSRSTKLVHGGLRYLEHLEFKLVKDVGRERAIVYNNAAHIVFPAKILLPIIKHGTLNKYTTSLALFMYDYLAGVKPDERRRMLSLNETLKKEPLLNSPNLIGGAQYYEYKTNDSRLTVEVIKKAVQYGLVALNYTELTGFNYENKKITGGFVTDLLNNQTYNINARYVVNATGIWVDELRKKDNSLNKKSIRHTKGIHIVIPHHRFPLQHSLYFDVGDKRMIFTIPRFDKVYIGTTDTDYKGSLENPQVEITDQQYLLNAVNRLMPSLNLSFSDIVASWAGLRPLIHEEGKSPSEVSRKDEVFLSPSGLISIAGGKLTGYRLMAKKVIDLIRKRDLNQGFKDISVCTSQNVKLSGGEFSFQPTVARLIEYADKKFDEAKQTQISLNDFKLIFYRYGTNIDYITNKAFDYYNQTRNTAQAWLQAELDYCIGYEMVTCADDYFIRRTGKSFFQPEQVNTEFNFVNNYIKSLTQSDLNL